MELSSQERGEIPMPLNGTSYGKEHGLGHIIPSLALQNSSNGPINIIMEDPLPYTNPNNKQETTVRYKECLKNHAASIGGNAIDGCGEFMPSGEEGTLEALTCSACNCHRNFHRKEIEGGCEFYNHRRVLLGHHHHKSLGYPTREVAPNQMMMSYNNNIRVGSFPSESDDQQEENGGIILARPTQCLKKRFRTKFTQEQKEKMLNFAEKVGWKIQKQEESVVQQFCQEIGVKRRVLKVWMHNNKLNLAKNNNISTTSV